MAELEEEGSLLSAKLSSDLTFSGLENTVELCDTVRSLFPDSIDIKIHNIKGIPERFQAHLAANLCNERDVETFITRYSRKNNETLKVATTR